MWAPGQFFTFFSHRYFATWIFRHIDILSQEICEKDFLSRILFVTTLFVTWKFCHKHCVRWTYRLMNMTILCVDWSHTLNWSPNFMTVDAMIAVRRGRGCNKCNKIRFSRKYGFHIQRYNFELKLGPVKWLLVRWHLSKEIYQAKYKYCISKDTNSNL